MDYETFVASESKIPDGQEVMLLIRDKVRFQSMPVKAIVHRDLARAGGSDRLWVMSPMGVALSKTPWAIRIIEEFPEDEAGRDEFRKCDDFYNQR